MTAAYNVTVGHEGRIALPKGVRERARLTEGTSLVLLDAPDGLVLLTREQLRTRVREELEGLGLVGDLLAERRRSARSET